MIDNNITIFCNVFLSLDRQSQLPRCLRRRSEAARLLRLWVLIPVGMHGYLSVVSVMYCQVKVSAMA